ncbi:MAG: efflux RND transporter periplasmic adaptor subunit [Acidobacteriota bacterium]|nr:efflux RND transporter periplasmic adaptor subunit [Acidobacteriota bacterium]
MAEGMDETERDESKKAVDAKGPEPVVEAVDEDEARTDDEEEIESVTTEDEVVVRKRPLYKRPAFLAIAAILLIVAAIFGVRYWLYARAHESTDDAFIDGHVIQVSPKVSGYVAKVYVTDNQEVKAGDLVAELDARDYEARVSQARAALEAGEARLREAHTGVELTRANTRANVQQASATVQQARAGVASQRAAAAAERTRIAQASAGISTAQANLSQAQSQVAAAEAGASMANADVQRYQELYSKDEISRQRLDQAVAASRTANAQLEAARGRVAAAEAQVREAQSAQTTAAENARRAETQVGGAQAGVNEAMGRLAQANTAPQQVAVSQAQAETAGATIEQLRAALEQAELELSYTKIYAPESGRVTRKAVEEGALIQVGQPLMAIVPGDVWVTANFKENQIGYLKPGQPVEIYVDAYPDKVFKGKVDSIQSGTGARFSLIPPENATGNYVKVVQRVPVKIDFEKGELDAQHLLAPGMSVVPEVKIK